MSLQINLTCNSSKGQHEANFAERDVPVDELVKELVDQDNVEAVSEKEQTKAAPQPFYRESSKWAIIC